MKRIIIIGGGAAGMTAAIAAAQERRSSDRKSGQETEICILEHKDCVGKKLLSTGNGRCNFTNEVINGSCFHSENPEVIQHVLEKFGREDTLKLFRGLGIYAKSKNGYYYPRSEQAAVVRELFQMRLESLGVKICTGVHVNAVKKEGKDFCIYASRQSFSPKNSPKHNSLENGSVKKTDSIQIKADKVILTSGGMAASVLGSDGSGYDLAKALGHSIVPVVPALVQLKVKEHPLKKAAGVRTDGTVSIYENKKLMGSDTGELQITEYGISGIPVFQVSRHASKALYYKRLVRAEIDFLPELPEDTMIGLLRYQKKKHNSRYVSDALLGIFNKKLIPCLLKQADISPRLRICELNDTLSENLVRACRHFPLTISETNGFEHAQVCAGGVRLTEIDASTMESLRCKGLYLAGELLDADGICGGYNLQWAWATGSIAGRSAASA